MGFFYNEKFNVLIFSKDENTTERISKIASYYKNLDVKTYETESKVFKAIKQENVHIVIFDISGYKSSETAVVVCKRLTTKKRGYVNIFIADHNDVGLILFCYHSGIRSVLLSNFSKKELDEAIGLAIDHFEQWESIFQLLDINNDFENELNNLLGNKK